jgi:Cu(I)/Ag(I) efflux system membrane protein CusA/SilA
MDAGGRTFEIATTQFFVRGRGYIRNIRDLEDVVLKVKNGVPIYLKNVSQVHLGPGLRYGVGELNGQGEVVGGIVVMRYGENALNVINGVKKRIEEIKSSLPAGVRIVPTYDRSMLIYRAIDTLREKLLEESFVVAVICVLFLWHVRSALVAIITLPVAIILSFIPMFAPVDVEHHVARRSDCRRCDGRRSHYRSKTPIGRWSCGGASPNANGRAIRCHSECRADGATLFFSLLVITVSFIPVFSGHGRTSFRPLGIQDLLPCCSRQSLDWCLCLFWFG